jgi:hypothetical protein
MLPPGPLGDLALRRACRCFGDALGRFIELRRSATVDPEDADQSDTTRLAAARSKWSHALRHHHRPHRETGQDVRQ